MNDDPNILYCIIWASRVYFRPMIRENCVSINLWDGVDIAAEYVRKLSRIFNMELYKAQQIIFYRLHVDSFATNIVVHSMVICLNTKSHVNPSILEHQAPDSHLSSSQVLCL